VTPSTPTDRLLETIGVTVSVRVTNVVQRAARRARSPRAASLATRIIGERLTYLDEAALLDLNDRAAELERDGRAGIIIETGCALGGSALMLTAAKAPARPLFLYDTFAMIPPPSEHDGADVTARYDEIVGGKSQGIGGDRYYGYEDDLLSRVRATMRTFDLAPEANNVTFVQGLYEDTLVPPGPVALAHVDCDWYESVKLCLERIWPALVPEGVIVIDDYDAWSGCHTAVDEFLATTDDVRVERRARVNLVKSLP
jgi:O-methyltransferase